MIYYIEMTQSWYGEIEADSEEVALEMADIEFSHEEVITTIEVLEELED